MLLLISGMVGRRIVFCLMVSCCRVRTRFFVFMILVDGDHNVKWLVMFGLSL